MSVIARWLIVGCIACQHEEPRREPPHPPPSPPAVTVAPPVDAAPARPVAVVATWSSKPPASPRAKWPSCITTRTRAIQYADVDAAGAPRFCLWSHLDLSRDPTIGCWRVDLATRAYFPETGVWFAALVPERVDTPVGMGTEAALDGDRTAWVGGNELGIRRGAKKLASVVLPGAGGDYIVLAGKAGLFAVGSDGRVLVIDPDTAKIMHEVDSPPCAAR